MTSIQKPKFKSQQNILEMYNAQHQRSNPMMKQAQEFLKRHEERKRNA